MNRLKGSTLSQQPLQSPMRTDFAKQMNELKSQNAIYVSDEFSKRSKKSNIVESVMLSEQNKFDRMDRPRILNPNGADIDIETSPSPLKHSPKIITSGYTQLLEGTLSVQLQFKTEDLLQLQSQQNLGL